MEMEMLIDSSTLPFPYYYHYPTSVDAAYGSFHTPSTAAAPPHGVTVVDDVLEPPDNNPAAASTRSRAARNKAERRQISKICTAGGMRHRRMRLSIDVARRFFALQDKLGFDKASKTVQWLLHMSKAGINDLAATTSEDGSVLLQTSMADSSADRNKQQQVRSNLKIRKNINECKDSRSRARQRARERTRERNCLRWSTAIVNQSEAPPPPAPAAEACSYNVDEQLQQDQPWELSGVVFAKAHRFQYSTHG